ncbi:H+-ATPase, subunit H [Gammaproteobacteria bacterium]
MEAILKRLLDAETKAQHLLNQTESECERIVHEALANAQAAAERFTIRVPEIQSSFIDNARGRAAQAVDEMRRRHEDRLILLKQLAREHQEKAIEAALTVVLDSEQA